MSRADLIQACLNYLVEIGPGSTLGAVDRVALSHVREGLARMNISQLGALLSFLREV